jgi:hypothetical protein
MPPLRSSKKSPAEVCAFFASAFIGVEAIALMQRISSLTCFHGVSPAGFWGGSPSFTNSLAVVGELRVQLGNRALWIA